MLYTEHNAGVKNYVLGFNDTRKYSHILRYDSTLLCNSTLLKLHVYIYKLCNTCVKHLSQIFTLGT